MKTILKSCILLMVAVLSVLIFYSEEKLKDVSNEPEFRPIVGVNYEIVDAVDGYGIRRHSEAAVEYITLIPPPGIAGSEVGFKFSISLGTKFTVIKVLKTNRWIDPNMSLVVKLEGMKMSPETPIRIDLFRGNEGSDYLQLNPRIYRRV